MIHVVITGPPRDGKYPYRIEGQSCAHGRPLHNLAARNPLLDACCVLHDAGEPADHIVALSDQQRFPGLGWVSRTTVGYGSRAMRGVAGPPVRYPGEAATPIAGEGQNAPAGSLDAGVPTEDDMADYREFPGGPIKTVGDRTHPDVAKVLNAPPATPAAPPPPPRTPQEPPAEEHPAHAKPAKSGKSHHPRKPKGSGGRRGHSRGR